MSRIGMDAEDVEAAGRSLSVRASEIDAIVGRIDAIVRGVPGVWVGPQADRFVRELWPEQRRMLVAARSRIAGLGKAALANAADQRGVSSHEKSESLRRLRLGAPGPSTTEGLLSGIRDMDKVDGFRMQEVVGSDGQTRFIVYIAGTFGAEGGQLGWEENAAASVGLPTDTRDYIAREMLKRMKDHPDAEVMIVGHSQGGMLAEALASDKRLNVKEVITFGSPPVASLDAYGGANVTRIQHLADPVVGVVGGLRNAVIPGLAGLNPLMQVDGDGLVTTFMDGNPFEIGGEFGVHGLKEGDYNWMAQRYDDSELPWVAAARDRQAVFLNGTVVDDSDVDVTAER